MKIYLMRHGETKWNKRSKLQGQVDIPLAPKGIEQAEMTSEGMKDIPFDHIFSSPLKRAYKTAQVVRRDRPIEIVRDDRLKEMSFGTSEGKIIGKIMANPAMVRYQRFRLDPAHFRPAKYGEYFQDVLKTNRRILSRRRLFHLEGKAENVLIVAHGCVVRSFILNLTGAFPLGRVLEDAFWKELLFGAAFEYKNGEINMIYENKLYYDVDCPDWQQQVPVYKKGRAR